MKKVILRILLFCIFVPFVYVILFILPHYNFLALSLSIVIVAAIGLIETKNLFKKRNIPHFNILTNVMGILLPITAYIYITGITRTNIFLIWIILSLIAILVRSIWIRNEEELSIQIKKITSSIFIMIYPCLFLSFLILTSSLNNGSFSVLMLICLIYCNDSAAYVFGKLLGKKLNLFISPNKSLIGFIAGMFFSISTAVVFYLLKPELFKVNIIFIILFGAVIGATTIIGDLIESVIKRATNVKDSGAFMMGRGGILDSIDSVLISAPVFYFLYPYIAN